jgi:hypothetical protein
MSTINDGGAAFPSQNDRDAGGDFQWGNYGMSLRDFIAIKMMPHNRELYGREQAARESYKDADALLAEREKPKP